MNQHIATGKYSFGMGDRFGRQAQAQLMACMRAAAEGVAIVPVWNKSNREHITIGSEPRQSRAAADAAVKALHWTKPYFVDADHIRQGTVDRYLPHADYYTIDVAEWIGQAAPAEAGQRFLDRHKELLGEIGVGNIVLPIKQTDRARVKAMIERMVNKYYLAVQQAGRIYRHIAQAKGAVIS